MQQWYRGVRMSGVVQHTVMRAVVVAVTCTLLVHALTQQDGCSPDQLACKDGSCVPLSRRCNFVADCPAFDDTDEEGCAAAVCTFEDGLCGWTIEASDATNSRHRSLTKNDPTFTWELSQGFSSVDPPLQQYKPDTDLTTHKPSGYYLYASSKGDTADASTSLATNTSFGDTAKVCRLTFWYWWAGPDPGFLHVMVRPSGEEPFEVWLVEGNHNKTWQLAEMSLGDLSQSSVIIEATRGVIYEGGGAIDDITFENCQPPSPPPDGHECSEFDLFECDDGNCCREQYVCDYSHDCLDNSDEKAQVCKTYMFRCSFEDGFTKDWQQDFDDDTEWILRQGAAGEGLDSIPQTDHTKGTGAGHYIMMDVKAINAPEMVARLHSPVIVGTVKQCQIRFWCLVTGTSPGILKIYKRVSYSSDGLTLLETIMNVPRKIWFATIISIEPTGQDYQVVFEGVSPEDRNGHIVLDDLSMTPTCEKATNQNLPGGNVTTTAPPFCFPGQLPCRNGDCYYPMEACNFMDDCGDNTDEESCSKACNFEVEDDFCGWFEGTGSSAPWLRIGFPAEPPGPSTDYFGSTLTHALGTMNGGFAGTIALFNSLGYTTVHEKCYLGFYHFLNGTGSKNASLSLYRKAEIDVAEGYGAELLWQQSSYTAEWRHEQILIGDKRDFILIFKAVHSDGQSYIALDDLSFHECVSPSNECHSTLDFQCFDGSCVPYQDACDANYDCADKSDEYECDKNIEGNCDFDEPDWITECGWEQSEEDDKDWAAASSSSDQGLGPPQDHGLYSLGKYIYIDSQDELPGKVATVSTGTLYPASRGICYVSFWVYMHNDDYTVNIGTLRLDLEEEGGERHTLLTLSGNYLKEWRHEMVLVSSDTAFYLLFEAETGDPFQTYIALDDVSVTDSCITGDFPPHDNTTCEIDERACDNGQCIPADFFCDCVMDCQDGSDEGGCFDVTCKTTVTRPRTTTTTPVPSPCNVTQFFCGDESSTCVPGLLVCDGVKDCPNGADETECPAEKCDPGFVYCGDQYMPKPCMPVTNLCNRQIFCDTYHADESLCGVCPVQYCQNSGTCNVTGTRLPSCSCTARYEGYRCERYVPKDSSLTGGEIAGIVIGSLLLVGLVGALGFVVYRRQRSSNKRTDTQALVMGDTKVREE